MTEHQNAHDSTARSSLAREVLLSRVGLMDGTDAGDIADLVRFSYDVADSFLSHGTSSPKVGADAVMSWLKENVAGSFGDALRSELAGSRVEPEPLKGPLLSGVALLKAEREARGMNFNEFGTAIGVHGSTIGKIEGGRGYITKRTALACSRFTGIDASRFVTMSSRGK